MVEVSNRPKKKEEEKGEKKEVFLELFLGIRNEFFLFLISVPNLLSGTKKIENKSVNKRVSVLFLSRNKRTKEQKKKKTKKFVPRNKNTFCKHSRTKVISHILAKIGRK